MFRRGRGSRGQRGQQQQQQQEEQEQQQEFSVPVQPHTDTHSEKIVRSDTLTLILDDAGIVVLDFSAVHNLAEVTKTLQIQFVFACV